MPSSQLGNCSKLFAKEDAGERNGIAFWKEALFRAGPQILFPSSPLLQNLKIKGDPRRSTGTALFFLFSDEFLVFSTGSNYGFAVQTGCVKTSDTICKVLGREASGSPVEQGT